MSLLIRTAAGLEDAADVFLGADAEEAWIRTPDGLKQFYGKFAVTAGPLNLFSAVNSAHSSTVTTREAKALVEGAVGDVTYLWTQTSGDPLTIVTPTLATTSFSGAVGPGQDKSGEFICTVSDEGGHSAASDPIAATITNRYGGVL